MPDIWMKSKIVGICLALLWKYILLPSFNPTLLPTPYLGCLLFKVSSEPATSTLWLCPSQQPQGLASCLSLKGPSVPPGRLLTTIDEKHLEKIHFRKSTVKGKFSQ